ncbi:DUF1758 domain-containing protein [Aphis craccivora]|uniref:DUF1758 domain-containing protein n=1 Tax=Aphis craccivora TaxID=307492 RepID=A0A6G0Y2L1_APHCR|nr:DUF1758 domain-containing protein [Aphis craccivora]
MADDMSNLTTRRGTLKGRITKFLKYLQDFPQDGDISQIRIEERWDEFQRIQSTIETKVTEKTAAETEEAYRFEFEDLYFQAVVDSDKIINKSGHTSNQKTSNNSGNSEIPDSTASSRQASILILKGES